jgi:hypothetical protein
MLNMRRAVSIHAFSMLFLAVVLGIDSKAQVREGPAAGLVRFLQRAPDDVESFGMGNGCADSRPDRLAAMALVSLGEPVVPEIEKALDSIVKPNRLSEVWRHSVWLLYAYAKIKGPGAYPRLQGIVNSPMADQLGAAVDRAVALASGLTSYVSSFHQPPGLRMTDGRTFFCRAQEPRDALDRLILGWEKNDLSLVQASLGPNARSALNRFLKENLGSSHPEPPQSPMFGVGYRFDVAGRWASPEETLDEKTGGDGDIEPRFTDPQLETMFTTSSGRDCGRVRLSFLNSGSARDGQLEFLINNSDIGDVLLKISDCAARGVRQP